MIHKTAIIDQKQNFIKVKLDLISYWPNVEIEEIL